MIYQKNLLCKFPNNFSIIVMKKKTVIKSLFLSQPDGLND